MGRAGRDLVEREYSVDAIGPRLVEIVQSARHCRRFGAETGRWVNIGNRRTE
jgi:hypothetical protein